MWLNKFICKLKVCAKPHYSYTQSLYASTTPESLTSELLYGNHQLLVRYLLLKILFQVFCCTNVVLLMKNHHKVQYYILSQHF